MVSTDQRISDALDMLGLNFHRIVQMDRLEKLHLCNFASLNGLLQGRDVAFMKKLALLTKQLRVELDIRRDRHTSLIFRLRSAYSSMTESGQW